MPAPFLALKPRKHLIVYQHHEMAVHGSHIFRLPKTHRAHGLAALDVRPPLGMRLAGWDAWRI